MIEVSRVGEKIVVPENIDLNDAIATLQRKAKEEDSPVNVIEPIEGFI